MKRSLKVLKRNSKKCAEAEVNENKQKEYTKKLMKEIPIRKCVEAENKYHSMIRIIEVD